MDKPCFIAAHCVIRRLSGTDSIALYPKRRGELAELIFVLKAATMGLAVCKPFGDSFPYDVVVENGEHRMLRIQIKSTFTSGRTTFCINLGTRGEGTGHRVYTPDEIDFLAAYVVAHDTWYIIPATELGTRRHVRVYPTGSHKKGPGPFEPFREAWHLITGTAPAPAPPPDLKILP